MKTPCFLGFYLPWDPISRAFREYIERIALEYGVHHVKLDAEDPQNQNESAKFDVHTPPEVLLLDKEGCPVDSWKRRPRKETVVRALERNGLGRTCEIQKRAAKAV